MKVYSIKTDTNNVQRLIPEIDEDEILDYLNFECESKIENWKDVNWYVHNPKKKRKNFFSLGSSGSFAFDKQVYDSELFALFEMAGEILSINVEGEEMYILNVMECINSLDQNSSEWAYYEDGSKGRILKFAFHEDRLSESSIYKIPETCKVQILTYINVKDEFDEFIGLYNKLNFKGLIFDELFESQNQVLL